MIDVPSTSANQSVGGTATKSSSEDKAVRRRARDAERKRRRRAEDAQLREREAAERRQRRAAAPDSAALKRKRRQEDPDFRKRKAECKRRRREADPDAARERKGAEVAAWRAKQYATPNARFKRDFLDRSFGYTCKRRPLLQVSMPVRDAKDGGRAAASLFNLKGRVSYVKKGYGFIAVDEPERVTVYAHRSTIVNPKPGDPRDFGGLKEGDSVIVDVKESPPKFKVRHQAVRVELGDYDAAQRDIPSVSAEYDGPNKAENEILNQVGTVAVVDGKRWNPDIWRGERSTRDFRPAVRRSGGPLRSPLCCAKTQAESSPSTPSKTFNAPRSPTQLNRQVLLVVSPGAAQASFRTPAASLPRHLRPLERRATLEWCIGRSTRPSMVRRVRRPFYGKLCAPRPAENQALPFPPTPCLEHQGPRQRNAESGASVLRTRPQQTALFPAPFLASNHSVHDKAEGHNTDLTVYDTNVASRTSAPVLIQSSTAATENPAERGRSARCKAVWAMDMDRSSTKANPAVPAAGHYIPAGTEKPP
ncbi:hypothetical protein HPB51_006515 [Rhipicephalus microplus]|uniref:CSD domain-containing protein n=1 Tax=Rhipicephalus microplus TaxID=6941 RepID=A0A9J6E664_RHIMP|nr:hypothetical protein HPB51_006515 [Rhipicephalus microplus]